MRRFTLVVLAAAAVLAPVGCGGSTATTSGSPGDSPEYREQMQKGGDTRGTAR